MLHTFGHDQKFTFRQFAIARAQFHAEAAAHNQKQFVFILMKVPRELPLEFH